MRHPRVSSRKTAKGLGSAINHLIQNKLTPEQRIAGDITNKIPVYLSDGKTVVFAKSLEDVDRVRALWEKHITHHRLL
jgi:hypothetical protein